MSARGGHGPAKLMLLLLFLTVVYQVYLNLILTPLTTTLSDDLMAANEQQALEQANEDGASVPIDPETQDVQPNLPFPQPSNNKSLNSIALHFKRGGLFAPFLFNGNKSQYPALRRQLWDAFPGRPAPEIPQDLLKHAYHHPAITAQAPKLWLVRDELGVSKQEIKENASMGIEVSDEAARFDGHKGKVVWDEDDVKSAPIWKDRVEF
jgi:hypothetical protein